MLSEPNQQPAQTQDGKTKRVLISLLGGTFIGGTSGVIIFSVTLWLIRLLVLGINLGPEAWFFALLALPFYFSLPVSLIVALLVGVPGSFFIYKKGLRWLNSHNRRTRRSLLGGILFSAAVVGICASLTLLVYVGPILSVLN